MNRTMLALAAILLTLAPWGASGAAVSTPTREALTAYMVALQGPDYNPLAEVTVTWGYYPNLQTDTMTADEHLELYVDHLIATGQTFCANPTHVNAAVPSQLVGTVCFHEVGYKVTTPQNTPGASCPTATAAVGGELDVFGSPADGVTESGEHVQTYTSKVSLYGKYDGVVDRFVNSRLVVFPGSASASTADEYSYGGSTPWPLGHKFQWLYVDWTWLDEQIPGDALFSDNELLWVDCWEEGGSLPKIHNDSIVSPRAWLADTA